MTTMMVAPLVRAKLEKRIKSVKTIIQFICVDCPTRESRSALVATRRHLERFDANDPAVSIGVMVSALLDLKDCAAQLRAAGFDAIPDSISGLEDLVRSVYNELKELRG